MSVALLAADAISPQITFLSQCLNGLSFGALIALIALGYTMVYGIIGLINFAHGDLFMLGAFLAWTLVGWLDLEHASGIASAAGIALLLLVVPAFCAGLNWSVERIVYKPLRNAPKLAPLVSAIGVSFVFMNVGEFWGGESDNHFPSIVNPQEKQQAAEPDGPPQPDALKKPEAISSANLFGKDSQLYFSREGLLLIVVVVPVMIGLTILVKHTQLGRAMRAVSQNQLAAQLMGIDVDRVIGATFLIGGALAGVAGVIYGQYIHSVNFQMGYQNGLYAFTAAVLGGIGSIPGAVLGGLLIGLVSALGRGYLSEHWANAVIFGILILILVFRPAGLLGERIREKV